MPGNYNSRPQPQRDLDWQALIQTALTAPGRMGDTYNRYYNYSFLNQMFLLQQGVLEPVATYNRWQSLGRQVLKGSKAKVIVRPIFIEMKDEHGGVTGDKILKFKVVNCLFTLSETKGEPLPPVEHPEWDYALALRTLDITERPFTGVSNGNIQGYSVGRELAINPTAKHPTKTRLHEIGHIVLGHSTEDSIKEYQQHRGLFEFGAESTAYLTTHELGLIDDEQAAESRAYVQHWLGADIRPSDHHIRQVFSATDRILRAGREQPAQEAVA